MASHPAIIVENLRKTYVATKKDPGVSGAVRALFSRATVEVEAVKDISFEIPEGELVGFLGPNGAGKTTTLKMLSGILFPTSGRATVLGHTPWERRNDYLRQISLVMGQKNQLWWDLPAIDSFLLLKEIYEIPDGDYKRRLDELSELLDIGRLLSTQVRKLSLGERMKCELVAALLHNPRVVFLDEPTIGLDVVSQKKIREFLKRYRPETGSTIILTSHYMQDIQELCDRVIIIDRGEKVFDDTLTVLVQRYSDVKRLSLVFSEPVAEQDVARYGTLLERDDFRAVLEAPRSQVTQIAAQILSVLPVVDIAIEDVEAEEIIRQIFTHQQ
ncbi:MAG: ATP-binding cassette domain-containing protein [Capsulimonadaceae bacterium]|nr:ATP-binding cassette domain-containing protein [Capsulimonadaceae bacterium]